jgi:hypothetical protein
MIGDVDIGGVYFPLLVLLGIIGLGITGLLTRLINAVGGYRLIVYRPIADLAIFILVLGALVLLTMSKGAGA